MQGVLQTDHEHHATEKLARAEFDSRELQSKLQHMIRQGEAEAERFDKLQKAFDDTSTVVDQTAVEKGEVRGELDAAMLAFKLPPARVKAAEARVLQAEAFVDSTQQGLSEASALVEAMRHEKSTDKVTRAGRA